MVLGSMANYASAQDAPTDASSPADLPVTRVVLFTNGVGYFEHSGTVTGDQDVVLDVAGADMDDLLQSLVLQDFDGGSIRPVRYGSEDPLERILSSYALDLAGNPSLAQILTQARGEAVHIEAGRPIDGSIVNVEQVTLPDIGLKTYLTLLTATGLRRVALDEVADLRFEDPDLRSDFAAALDAIHRYRGDDDKLVRLRFEGDGTRDVRVGYVREMPVWKTSYRLVVGDDGMADLQGWAIFDNPTDLDLEDVSVSFVAGQPISFVTGLYEPVYVARPHVAVSTAPSLVPPAYAKSAAPAPMADARAELAMMEDAAAGISASQSLAAAPQLGGAGVSAAAEGFQTGATFEYRVSEPVSIGRHESAMIPIVQQRVPAERVSVYDTSLLASHPLRGLRLTNDTGLHLAAGPVTVFGDSGFTGNAQLGDVVDGESRLLSYAVDLDVDVQTQRTDDPQHVTTVSIRNGVVETSMLRRSVTRYTFTTSADEGRFVIVEHAKRQGFEVVAPGPAPAETQTHHRFGVAIGSAADGGQAAVGQAAGAVGDGDAPAQDADPSTGKVPTQLRCELGAPCTLEVVEERTDATSIAIDDLGSNDIALFLVNAELSDADRATFERILGLKRDLGAVAGSLAQQDARTSAIRDDQTRVRQNMAALDRDSALYRRYVSNLEAQEDELARIEATRRDLQQRQQSLQDQLDALIEDLAGTD